MTMKLYSDAIGDVLVVEVRGVVNSRAAGALYDGLVQGIVEGATRIVVDLAGASVVTRAGIRGLVVAARMLAPARGAMRICGAGRRTEELLRDLGMDHLLKRDACLEASLRALSVGPVALALRGQAAA